jgi:hypothetical protein
LDDCTRHPCPSVPPPMQSRLSPSSSATTFSSSLLPHLDAVDSRIAMVTGYPPTLPSLTFSEYDDGRDSDAGSQSDIGELATCRDCISTSETGHAPFLYFAPVPEGPQPKIVQDDAVSCLGQELWRAMSLDS